MDLFNKIMSLLDRLFGLIELILICGMAVGGFILSWWFLGAAEVGLFARIGYSLIVALISAFLTWIAWWLLRVFN